MRPRSETTWPSWSPGLRVELTINSSRRRRPRRPRHPSPPATCCYPTRTGLTQSTCFPGVDSFAIATATTQLGTGSASESSYPDKRPGPATIRRPGQPHLKGHPITSTSPAHGAHSPLNPGPVRRPHSRPRPPRSDSSPLPAPQLASGPEHRNILPEGQRGTRTPSFTAVAERYTTRTNCFPFYLSSCNLPIVA